MISEVERGIEIQFVFGWFSTTPLIFYVSKRIELWTSFPKSNPMVASSLALAYQSLINCTPKNYKWRSGPLPPPPKNKLALHVSPPQPSICSHLNIATVPVQVHCFKAMMDFLFPFPNSITPFTVPLSADQFLSSLSAD